MSLVRGLSRDIYPTGEGPLSGLKGRRKEFVAAALVQLFRRGVKAPDGKKEDALLVSTRRSLLSSPKKRETATGKTHYF